MFLVFFYFERENRFISTFHMTSEPNVIVKGHYGQTLIVELSYSHNGLEQWITQLSKPFPLFLVDAQWIERSEPLVRLLIDKQIPVGLLGKNNESYEGDDLLTKELNIFEKAFDQQPLWFMTRDYNISTSLQRQLFTSKINMLAPSISFPSIERDLENGDIISILLHRETEISFETIQQFQQQHSFLSIEENLFGYSISTKRYP